MDQWGFNNPKLRLNKKRTYPIPPATGVLWQFWCPRLTGGSRNVFLRRPRSNIFSKGRRLHVSPSLYVIFTDQLGWLKRGECRVSDASPTGRVYGRVIIYLHFAISVRSMSSSPMDGLALQGVWSRHPITIQAHVVTNHPIPWGRQLTRSKLENFVVT